MSDGERGTADPSALRFDRVLDGLTRGVIVHRRDRSIAYANAAACAALGLSRDQLLGLTPTDPRWRTTDAYGDTISPELHPVAVAFDTGRPVLGVVLGIANPALGERRWLRLHAVPELERDDPCPRSVTVAFEDATEAHEAAWREQLDAQILEAASTAHDEQTFRARLAAILRERTGFAEAALEEAGEGRLGALARAVLHGAPLPEELAAEDDDGPTRAPGVLRCHDLPGVGSAILVAVVPERAVLRLHDRRKGRALPHFARSLQSAASLVAAALARFRLEAALRWNNATETALGKLRTISLEDSGVQRLAEAALQALDASPSPLGSHASGVLLFDPADGSVLARARRCGTTSAPHCPRLFTAEGCRELPADGAVERSACGCNPGGRRLLVPIRAEGRTLGALGACTGPEARDERIVAYVRGIASIVASGAQRLIAERDLRGSEDRFRRILETASEGICVLDGARLVFANLRLSEMLGCASRELAGASLLDFTPADDHGALGELLRRSGGGERARGELRLTRADGGLVHVQLSASPLAGARGEAQVLAMVTDLTAHREAQLTLLQSQKLEAVGRLAGGIAHDFNNLLSVVMSFSSFLVDELPPESALRVDAEEIRKAAERGCRLTRQLLAFSRRGAAEPVVTTLNESVREMEKLLRRAIGEDLELVIALADDPCSIHADPGHLEQVLLNLAVNARDAMPRGGRLEITTANAEPGAGQRPQGLAPQARYAVLSVADTGHGIDPAVLPRIFDPFFTTKGEGKGTGLGLSTVAGLVEQAGGRVEVASTSPRGTTFRVWLPAHEAAASAASRPAAPDELRGRGETVLVVEDDDAVRSLTRRLLQKNGYEVIEARDGEEALAACAGAARPVDLLLTDVVMPNGTGRELAERLRALHLDPAVLYMSGYPRDVLHERGGWLGGGALVTKPFAEREILLQIQAALRGDAPRA